MQPAFTLRLFYVDICIEGVTESRKRVAEAPADVTGTAADVTGDITGTAAAEATVH